MIDISAGELIELEKIRKRRLENLEDHITA